MEGSSSKSPTSTPTIIDLDKCPSPVFPPGMWNYGMTPFMPLGPMPNFPPHQFVRPPYPGDGKENRNVHNLMAVKVEEAMKMTTVNMEEPPPKKKAKKPTSKSKKKINLTNLTKSQIEEVKQGGSWKEHWIIHLISIRGEFADVFLAPPKQGVDNWSKVHARLVSMCPEFNKDSEACRKKWAAIYKDYKYDKANNATFGSDRSDKCKWFLLVDEHMSTRANVVSHAHGSAHEPDGIPPVSTMSQEDAEKPLRKWKKEDSLITECLEEVRSSGKMLLETFQANESAKLNLFRSMQETMAKLVEKL